jgi:hypothetical protein
MTEGASGQAEAGGGKRNERRVRPSTVDRCETHRSGEEALDVYNGCFPFY